MKIIVPLVHLMRSFVELQSQHSLEIVVRDGLGINLRTDGPEEIECANDSGRAVSVHQETVDYKSDVFPFVFGCYVLVLTLHRCGDEF